jgi:hypothetical protein
MPQQGHERHETHAKRFTRGGKPTLTFNPANNLVYINAAGLRQLWEMEYALFIISSVEKRLSIFPCDADERDAVRLRSNGLNRNKPRYIRCRTGFTSKLLALMEWRSNYKYRIPGALAIGENNTILVFNLITAEVMLYES